MFCLVCCDCRVLCSLIDEMLSSLCMLFHLKKWDLWCYLLIVPNKQVHLFLDRSLLLAPLEQVLPKQVHLEALFNNHSLLLVVIYLVPQHLLAHQVNLHLVLQARQDLDHQVPQHLVRRAHQHLVLQAHQPLGLQ